MEEQLFLIISMFNYMHAGLGLMVHTLFADSGNSIYSIQAAKEELMPIFDYECKECGKTFESIEVWKDHIATKCKYCDSPNIHKVIGSIHIQMDADAVLRSVPDPSPPLEELRGKNKYGEGGYADKPEAPTRLRDYDRHKNKDGNWVWTEKKRTYFDQGGKR